MITGTRQVGRYMEVCTYEVLHAAGVTARFITYHWHRFTGTCILYTIDAEISFFSDINAGEEYSSPRIPPGRSISEVSHREWGRDLEFMR